MNRSRITLGLLDFWLLDAASEEILSSTFSLRQTAETAARNINFRQLPEDLWSQRFESLAKLLRLDLIHLRPFPGGEYHEPEEMFRTPSEVPFGDFFSYEAICTTRGGRLWEAIARPTWERYCGATWSPGAVKEDDGTLAELSVLDGGSRQAVEVFLKWSDFMEYGGDRLRTLLYSGKIQDWKPRHWKRGIEGWIGVFRVPQDSQHSGRVPDPEPEFPVWRQVGFNPASQLILDDPNWSIVVDI